VSLTDSAVEIRPSSVDELQALADVLFREHYDEVAKHKHVMRLSPDWLRYKALEQMDSLLMLGAWQDGMLVGYAVSFLVTHMHYSELLTAHNDVLFVAKEHRRGRLGLKLIRETERIAVSRGARMVSWHAKEQTALEALLPRIGYGVQDIIYSKEF
jgi:GNAT superfamily N-acetyltransferase